MALNCSDCRTLRNCVNLLSAKRFAARLPAQMCSPNMFLSLCFPQSAPWGRPVSSTPSPALGAGWSLLAPCSPEDSPAWPVAETVSCPSPGSLEAGSASLGPQSPTSVPWLQPCCVFHDSCFIA